MCVYIYMHKVKKLSGEADGNSRQDRAHAELEVFERKGGATPYYPLIHLSRGMNSIAAC